MPGERLARRCRSERRLLQTRQRLHKFTAGDGRSLHGRWRTENLRGESKFTVTTHLPSSRNSYSTRRVATCRRHRGNI
jgi:hypothetical protein